MATFYDTTKFESKFCEYCGATYRPSLTENPKRWARRRFCGNKCSGLGTGTLYKKGHEGLLREKNGFWRGGIAKYHSGYVRTIVGVRKYEAVHRKVMEEKLGRKLLRSEVVHHINGVKNDNRLENLMVMDTAEHTRLHFEQREPVTRNCIFCGQEYSTKSTTSKYCKKHKNKTSRK